MMIEDKVASLGQRGRVPLNLDVRGLSEPYHYMAIFHICAIILRCEPSFEWDPVKDAQNRRKHGVAFVDAQLAFLDLIASLPGISLIAEVNLGFIVR